MTISIILKNAWCARLDLNDIFKQMTGSAPPPPLSDDSGLDPPPEEPVIKQSDIIKDGIIFSIIGLVVNRSVNFLEDEFDL